MESKTRTNGSPKASQGFNTMLSICITHWTPTISEKPYNIRRKCCLSSEHRDYLHTNTLNSIWEPLMH
ncbi:hypothetical protein LOK49_LG03G03307 [Camellia lanceoleosa]|uniref:Uncharacterized protein n=1 Tax=Camellia lanceoleosa TaxID=1840588 RepID=A0ACC0IC70_9ERIC|nr:hypothetical protein LOK49_LG03G03307 [Camellia lanceoleosa]